jgi:hypothetical protein
MKNGFIGKKHTEKTKSLLREKRMGVPPSNKGKPSPLRGRKLSPEQIELRRKNTTQYWERKRNDRPSSGF